MMHCVLKKLLKLQEKLIECHVLEKISVQKVKKNAVYFLTSFFISSLFFYNSYANGISCPNTIVVKELLIHPREWEHAEVTQSKIYKNATLFLGELGDTSSSLAPEHQKSKRQITQKWDLQPYQKKGESIWLECQYFETNIKLRKMIPTTIHLCKSTFRVNLLKNPKEMPIISCQ